MNVKVCCEICGHELAYIDIDTIKLPLRGDMFKSPDPQHDYPPPFFPEAEYQYMRCPMCLKRPFLVEGVFAKLGGVFGRTNKVVILDGVYKADIDSHLMLGLMVPENLLSLWDGVSKDGSAPRFSSGENPEDVVSERVETIPILNITDNNEKLVMDLHAKGMRPGEIGKEIGMHHLTVAKIIRDNNGR